MCMVVVDDPRAHKATRLPPIHETKPGCNHTNLLQSLMTHPDLVYLVLS